MLLFIILYIDNIKDMKTIQEMQEQVYDHAINSGYFRNMQAQLKTYVFDLIEKEYNNGKSKIGFQYEHPLLPKLRKYPLTSLCMDLMQQFLQSFKFKHTLNVFKREINRTGAINRSSLAQQFKIQIKNPESQAVLLSLVSQMFTGEVGAIKSNIKVNNFVDSKQQAPTRPNHFIDPSKTNQQTNATKISQQNSFNNSNEPSSQKSNINSSVSGNSFLNDTSNVSRNSGETKKQSVISQPSKSQEQPSSLNVQSENSKIDESKKGKKQSKQKIKKEKIVEKPPEGATDLLGDVMGKFGTIMKNTDKQQEKKKIFEQKRAFSEEKQKKVLDPSESGVNKIKGVSLGKNMSSFMNKFMPAAAPKNQSFIDEELDQFQQSKDSTRKNPLFSSSQSGFDKSGFDVSVDSNAIQEYQYVERAKKFAKKF